MQSLTFKQQKWIGILFMIMSLEVIINYNLENTIPFIIDCPIYIAVCIFIFIHIIREKLFRQSVYIVYFIYLLYLGIQIIYGLFNAFNYWQYKGLLLNSINLLIPFFALLLLKPSTCIGVLGTWKQFINPKLPFFYLLPLAMGWIHFSAGPAYFLFALFFFWLPLKWKFSVGVVILLMLMGDWGDRAQVIKGLISIAFAVAIYYRKYIYIFFIHLFHWFFYLVAILFLILGLTGVFNIFSPEPIKDEITLVTNQEYGQEEAYEDNDLSADTRTFIYVETISSAIRHNYVIFGRSPARGNDTEAFADAAQLLNEDYVERNDNELCHLNIFTWLGIVGVFLYSFFYLQASFLALYRSNNIYVKYLSVLVAFHWAFGWVEDFNTFNMMNVGLWLIIGICLSPTFRSMTEKEFELWFKSIFMDGPVTLYHRYLLDHELSICKDSKKRLLHQFNNK